MTDTPDSGPAIEAAHEPALDAHGGHGGHDGDEPLGPVDWRAWAMSAIGVAAGLLIAVCLGIAANS